MNVLVNAELERLYKEGINPQVTDVMVEMDPKKMKVAWKVKIEQSPDGKAWMGLTSRGSGGYSAYYRANATSAGQDFNQTLKHVQTTTNEPNAEMKVVKDFLNNLTPEGKATGSCPVRQLFYAYTKPNRFPNH